ncbi:MAG: LAGLIDADG family homing endonuclease [Promethearchaeota archaeon]
MKKEKSRETKGSGKTIRLTKFHAQVDRFLLNHPEIIELPNGRSTIKRSPYSVYIPRKLGEELCRIIGIIHGDGNMSGKRVHVSDKSREYHETVVLPLFQKVFGITLNLYHDHERNSYYSHTKCKIVYYYLVEVLELPKGAVRPNIRIPDYLAFAPINLRASYIAGLFDSEAHVRKNQVEIDFYTTTPELMEFITNYLRKIGVNHSQMTRKRGKSQEYELAITERQNVHAFIDNTPLKHPDKLRTLQLHFPTD